MSESAADTAPTLAEWMTGTQVADALGVSRQHVNRMFNRGEFKTLHKLGDRPVLVVSTPEVLEKVENRAEREDAKAELETV